MAKSTPMLVAWLNDMAKNDPQALNKQIKLLGYDNLYNLLHTDLLPSVLAAIKQEIAAREAALIKNHRQGVTK